MVEQFSEFHWLSDGGREILRRAVETAITLGHKRVDPLHMLIAVWDKGWILTAADLQAVGLSRNAMVAYLNDIYGVSKDIERVALSDPLANVFLLAQHYGDPQITSWELLVAIWMSPGEHTRMLVPSRMRATRLIRTKAGVPRLSDHLGNAVLATRKGGRRLAKAALGAAESTWVGSLVLGMGRLVRSAFTGLIALISVIARPIEFLIFAPGIAVREGSRVILSFAYKTKRLPSESFKDLGWSYEIKPLPKARRHAAIQLIPSVVAMGVGVTLLVPSLVKSRTLGISLAPSVTSNIGDLGSATEPQLLMQFLLAGDTIWFALACMFVAVPPFEVTQVAMYELRAGEGLDKAAALVLSPLLVVGWLGRPVGWITERLGLSPFVGIGLTSLLASLALASWIADAVSQPL